jgi:uncharacterized protein (TIGR02466 family)
MRLGTGWKELQALPEFAMLMSYIREAFREYLKRSGARATILPQENSAEQDYPSIYSWFSVHTQNSSHDFHVHDDSMLSAAYYVSVPDGSGNIVFLDPRGHHPIHELQDSLPQPPFISFHRHEPRNGDIVIFPSWLPHGVMPTQGSEARVSLAFNLVGAWFGEKETVSSSSSTPGG